MVHEHHNAAVKVPHKPELWPLSTILYMRGRMHCGAHTRLFVLVCWTWLLRVTVAQLVQGGDSDTVSDEGPGVSGSGASGGTSALGGPGGAAHPRVAGIAKGRRTPRLPPVSRAVQVLLGCPVQAS